MMRLDKLIGELNIATRSMAKDIIRKGLIKVDDIVINKPEEKVDENKVTISYQGQLYKYLKFRYFIMNKPAGLVSATKDNLDKTVIDLFNELIDFTHKNDYFPAGRLDKDTEGLLLITNDGALAHRLLSPKYHVEKIYYVETKNSISDNDISCIEKGIDLGDFVSKEGKVKLISDRCCELTITEGKFHEVKRIFKSLGNEVTYLKRISFGGINLPEDLDKGYIRELSIDEINTLKDK